MSDLEQENKLLRLMLAVYTCGRTLYADDGELQCNAMHPNIDFKRDSADEIQRKLAERSLAEFNASLSKSLATAYITLTTHRRKT